MKPEIHPDNLDQNSGWLTKRYEITIKAEPEKIWEYAYDPETWTASNPDEHLGLTFYNDTNRPETGTSFYQKEKVSGVYADLHGHILYAKRPEVCVWTGLAEYHVFSLLRLRVPESGAVMVEPASEGSLVSHTVYLRIPETILGKLFFKISELYANKKGYVPHTLKELEYFKKHLEA